MAERDAPEPSAFGATPAAAPTPDGGSVWPVVPVRLPRVSISDAQRMLLLSIVIGLFAGLLVVCFHIAIDLIRWRTVGLPFGRRTVWTQIWPAIGAVAAACVRFVFRDARGSGVIHTKAALHVSDGVVPASTVPGKFVACAVAIGCGNSLGPEDPALQMGAGVASIIGRVFRLPRQYMRLVAPIWRRGGHCGRLQYADHRRPVRHRGGDRLLERQRHGLDPAVRGLRGRRQPLVPGRCATVPGADARQGPLAGQGASMAMTGAYVLAEGLNREEHDLVTALAHYEQRLKPTIRGQQRAARRMARWFVPKSRVHLAIRGALTRTSTWPVVSTLRADDSPGQPHR